MRKILGLVLGLVVMMTLVACGAQKLSQETLMKNNWVTVQSDDGISMEMTLSFDKDEVKVTPKVKELNTKEIDEDALALGEDFLKGAVDELAKSLETTSKYTIKDNEVVVESTDFSEGTGDYKIKMKDGNLVIQGEDEVTFKPVKK
ncbi:hypothetical protein G7081_00400 [Vagococcus coleopterorum]|uniref:Lipoprotein n=1 Tax=Vagococcus coleopterorum TaxID=2714946 RepID=A0A6G8AL15_9ENTE|nr:hypothetical protein [Vagococcus coleopterorum]QIL45652.1 hypothetical protein G7081_00400 [Vagococcus coleopterorum]